jgi:hypothetical protein
MQISICRNLAAPYRAHRADKCSDYSCQSRGPASVCEVLDNLTQTSLDDDLEITEIPVTRSEPVREDLSACALATES